MFLKRARFKNLQKKHQNTFRRSYFYTLAQLDINAIKTFEQQQKKERKLDFVASSTFSHH